MSRTYRRKEQYNANHIPEWVYRDRSLLLSELEDFKAQYGDSIERVEHCSWGFGRYDVVFTKNSKEGRKRLARYRSDADTDRWNRPQGHWVNLYSTRPLRRKSKNELHKYLFDDTIEIMVTDDVPLGYWD